MGILLMAPDANVLMGFPAFSFQLSTTDVVGRTNLVFLLTTNGTNELEAFGIKMLSARWPLQKSAATDRSIVDDVQNDTRPFLKSRPNGKKII